MLKLKIEARLPVIGVYTKDLVNFPNIINALTGKTVYPYKDSTVPSKGKVYYFVHRKQIDPDAYVDLYSKMVEDQCTLIVINPPENAEVIHYDGTLPLPKAMLREAIASAVDEDLVDKLEPLFGGLTLLEVAEVLQITLVRDSEITPDGVYETRRTNIKPQAGLEIIDTKSMSYYHPSQELKDYADKNKSFFISPPDKRLRPRGWMGVGTPGTGKSQGAKYLAHQWNLPLFRMSTGILNKYVGESERFMREALEQLEHCAPCILLIDEVEKLLQFGSDSSGVMTRLFSNLLWWLQENDARVLVVMTCNKIEVLPPELYREGRLDAVMTFKGLGLEEGMVLAKHVLESFGQSGADIGDAFTQFFNEHTAGEAEKLIAHAAIVGWVTNAVRELMQDGEE